MAGDRLDLLDGQVGAGQDDTRDGAFDGHAGRIVGYLPPMLAFIDQIVIPFLNGLYGAVGYVGVMLAMAIESAMVPLPSELVLPYAGFLVSDPTRSSR